MSSSSSLPKGVVPPEAAAATAVAAVSKKRPATSASPPTTHTTTTDQLDDPAPPTKKVATTTTTTTGPRSSSTRSNKTPYKGLRHFSMMVCKKVEEKGTTTYGQVADELVALVLQQQQHQDDTKSKLDEKNIRRRVYDALNVLMAVDVIQKDKKDITWRGLPTTAAQDVELLQREWQHHRHCLERKRATLRELLTQQVCFRNLVQHNAQRDQPVDVKTDNKIPLPFIVINTSSAAVIQCNMSRDLTDVMFDFSLPFEINDDNSILKRMGMDKTTETVLQQMIPADMYQYCRQHNLLEGMLLESTRTAPTTTAGKDTI